MPTMWFAKNGRRPDTQEGPGIEISHEELETISRGYEVRFVSLDAPNINPELPPQDFVNVVVELEDQEPRSSKMYKTGFYLVVGLKPSTARSALGSVRP